MEINVKDILIKPLPAKIANEFVRAHHYSGKVVNNSQLHLGAFYNGVLHGVMSFGCPMDRSKVIGLVSGTKWNDFLELNRMAFDDYLPRNSESRCISVAMKIIKKHYPNIEWILSFADGTQCGDGTIYRASGFVLTQIKSNKSIIEFPNGEKIANLVLDGLRDCKEVKELCARLGIEHKYRTMSEWEKYGAKAADGFMLRYIYFINKAARKRLAVPIIPFSEIDKMNAGMYKGVQMKQIDRHK